MKVYASHLLINILPVHYAASIHQRPAVNIQQG
jgi:hypothetical protein